jgi:hypothetical protein
MKPIVIFDGFLFVMVGAHCLAFDRKKEILNETGLGQRAALSCI